MPEYLALANERRTLSARERAEIRLSDEDWSRLWELDELIEQAEAPAPDLPSPGQLNAFFLAIKAGYQRYWDERGIPAPDRTNGPVSFSRIAFDLGDAFLTLDRAVTIKGSRQISGDQWQPEDLELPMAYVIGDDVAIAEDVARWRAAQERQETLERRQRQAAIQNQLSIAERTATQLRAALEGDHT